MKLKNISSYIASVKLNSNMYHIARNVMQMFAKKIHPHAPQRKAIPKIRV
jgi:hypothetical protein